MHDQEDSTLVQRYLNGEHAAFEELYRKYRPRLAGYCCRLLRDVSKTEDVVQSVFAKALESIGTLRDPGSLYHWLFTVARNEVYAILRKTRSNTTVEFGEDVWERETPHDTVVRQETVQIVRECLDRLKIEYREVLILRQFEELSYREIAELTGSTVSSVESRLFKARKALVKQLKPYMDVGKSS